MMQKAILSYLLIPIFIVSGLTLNGCSPKNIGSKKQTNTAGVVIEFKDGRYNPSKITIKQNQTVTFMNHGQDAIWPASNIHPTHGIYPQFDPKKPIKVGDSWPFTFTKVGIWKFHDHLEPTITGEITVIE